MENKCTLLVSSCDRYECAWHPFFALLNRYWPSCPYSLALSTESKTCNEPNVRTINTGASNWSNRLKLALRSIDTPYVLFMLEDFFIQGNVRDDIIKCYLETMDNDSDIKAIYLKHIAHQKEESKWNSSLYKIDPTQKYSFNFQTGLWRTEELLKMLPDNASAWDIEENMTISQFSDGDFYCVKTGSYTECKDDPIPYLWALHVGYGICKSKWLWKNKEFFKNEGIDVDYTTLPHMSRFEYLCNKYLDRKYMRSLIKHYLHI